jgi:hypothetical protein
VPGCEPLREALQSLLSAFHGAESLDALEFGNRLPVEDAIRELAVLLVSGSPSVPVFAFSRAASIMPKEGWEAGRALA